MGFSEGDVVSREDPVSKCELVKLLETDEENNMQFWEVKDPESGKKFVAWIKEEDWKKESHHRKWKE